ncbi:hypothetical protein Lfu02_63170 [Longispora fulva]|nr:hypothetical protein Lfu02_63170 [Longispora fulva]
MPPEHGGPDPERGETCDEEPGADELPAGHHAVSVGGVRVRIRVPPERLSRGAGAGVGGIQASGPCGPSARARASVSGVLIQGPCAGPPARR